MGSARLPGKSMLRLQGKPIVDCVLRRVRRAQTLTEVVLATSDRPSDEVLGEVAGHLGIRVFRGPEEDVLRRYVLAAREGDADIVVRVCADNPLVAPEEIDRIVRHHLITGVDYSFNHRPSLGNRYPDGLGAEVLDFSMLEALDRKAVEATHREHVTAYIWDHPGEYHIETIPAPEGIAGPDIKLDVDTTADLARLEWLVSQAPCDLEFWKAEDIVKTYRSRFGKDRSE